MGVRFCPKCRSTHVRVEKDVLPMDAALKGVHRWVCDDCGWTGENCPVSDE